MRTVYFANQTKEFVERDIDIVFLGNLYLKGRPYNNPKEAVDKDYVDYIFDNIREENLKGTIKDENFPAFDGDLVNRVRTNNFSLKEVVRANKYHRARFDKKGRVIGGDTGKIKLNSDDIVGIDFNKLVYKVYKPIDGTLGIKDFTTGLNINNYWPKSRNITIDRPVAIESGPITDNNIINEYDMLNITDKYFIGQISGMKERTFSGYGDWGGSVSDNYDTLLNPWMYQRSFNPNTGKLFSGKYRILADANNTGLIKDLMYSRQLVVKGGHIYNATLYPYDNTKPHFWGMKLNADGSANVGTYKRGDVKFLSHRPDYPIMWLEAGKFLHNGNVWIRTIFSDISNTGLDNWSMLRYNLNGTSCTVEDVGLIKTLSSPYNILLHNKCGYYYEGNYPRLNAFEEDGTLSYYGSLPGETAQPDLGDNDFGQLVTIGGFVYSIPTSTVTSKLARIRLVNGIPSGEWSRYDCGATIPTGWRKFFTSKDKLYLVSKSGRVINIHSMNFNRNNGNLTGYTREITITINSSYGISDIVITKDHLFLGGYDFLVEVEYRGGLNDYTEQSMHNYKPPHP